MIKKYKDFINEVINKKPTRLKKKNCLSNDKDINNFLNNYILKLNNNHNITDEENINNDNNYIGLFFKTAGENILCIKKDSEYYEKIEKEIKDENSELCKNFDIKIENKDYIFTQKNSDVLSITFKIHLSELGKVSRKYIINESGIQEAIQGYIIQLKLENQSPEKISEKMTLENLCKVIKFNKNPDPKNIDFINEYNRFYEKWGQTFKILIDNNIRSAITQIFKSSPKISNLKVYHPNLNTNNYTIVNQYLNKNRFGMNKNNVDKSDIVLTSDIKYLQDILNPNINFDKNNELSKKNNYELFLHKANEYFNNGKVIGISLKQLDKKFTIILNKSRTTAVGKNIKGENQTACIKYYINDKENLSTLNYNVFVNKNKQNIINSYTISIPINNINHFGYSNIENKDYYLLLSIRPAGNSLKIEFGLNFKQTKLGSGTTYIKKYCPELYNSIIKNRNNYGAITKKFINYLKNKENHSNFTKYVAASIGYNSIILKEDNSEDSEITHAPCLIFT